MGDSEGCSWSSGVGDGSGSASGSGAGVSGLGDPEGSALVSEGSICSGMLLLSKGGVGSLLSSLGSIGLLSTDGCRNIGPDKSRDLSKSSRDGKDSILGSIAAETGAVVAPSQVKTHPACNCSRYDKRQQTQLRRGRCGQSQTLLAFSVCWY
jgi:hypothetical protein